MDWLNFRIHKRLTLHPESLEAVYSLLSSIDAVKNSWHITGKLLPQTIERLTYSVIVTSTGASNRIEGNKLSDAEVESLYSKLHIEKFKTRDEQEVAGYLKCLETIFDNYNDIPISESFILQLHRDMLDYSEKDIRHKGEYKFGSNRIEATDYEGNTVGVIFDPTPPHLVSKEMQELISWYQWAVEAEVKHPLILIANFILEYLSIHPFQDGNGRTSRLLTNLLLLQHGYNFTSLISHERLIEENKAEYYKVLSRVQSTWKSEQEQIEPWLIFFLNTVNLQSRNALEIIQGENIDYLLSEKQLALWHWAKRQQNNTFSRQDAVQALGFPVRTVESIIKKLYDLKRLEKVGQGRATRYRAHT